MEGEIKADGLGISNTEETPARRQADISGVLGHVTFDGEALPIATISIPPSGEKVRHAPSEAAAAMRTAMRTPQR